MLECTLKVSRREGIENVQHKPVTEAADIEKMNESPFLNYENPAGLLRRVWFIIALYWCRRGCEGHRALRCARFGFHKDADGREFVSTSPEELTKKPSR